MFDKDKNFIDSNQAGLDMMGYSREVLLTMTIADVDTGPGPGSAVPVHNQLFAGERITNYEHQLVRKDGKIITVLNNSGPLIDTHGIVCGTQSSLIDVTAHIESEAEKIRLHRELKQAQKMESLGHMCGGIAHDFNNLLNVITGYTGLALKICTVKGESKLINYLDHVKNASEHAANLISQLLSFSRMDQVELFPMELAPALKEDVEMIRAILPGTIELNTEIEENLPAVVMDPTQLHQVVMNLCINARDAMDGQGKLSIRLGRVNNLDTKLPVSHKPIKGDWVELSITDTGSGIEPDITENIFNPFFTTKEAGKGTGMGLFVVYGIMEKNAGHILVESEVHTGTTLRLLFLPITEMAPQIKGRGSYATELPNSHGENILVVDDEKSITT